ncbi:MAG: hypothetical protein ACE5JO_08065 [Candidatus Binatia bacterium]
MASIVAQVGFLVTLSRYKEWIFLFTAIFLSLSFYLTYRPVKECPPDSSCEVVSHSKGKLHEIILWASSGGFLLALFLSYLLTPMLDLLGYW